MKAFFNRFINNGTSGITDVFIIREVRLVNFFSYVILISLIFGLTNTFFVYNKFPELAALLLFVTSIFSLVFNYYKRNFINNHKKSPNNGVIKQEPCIQRW